MWTASSCLARGPVRSTGGSRILAGVPARPLLDNVHHDSGPGTGFAVPPDLRPPSNFRQERMGRSRRRQGFGGLVCLPTRPFPGGSNPVGRCEVPPDRLPPGNRKDSSRLPVQEAGTETTQVPPHRCLCGGNRTANSIAAQGMSFLPASAMRRSRTSIVRIPGLGEPSKLLRSLQPC